MAYITPRWTRMDVSMIRNPKMQRVLSHPAGAKAVVAYVESIFWSVEFLTDGLLPDWYSPSKNIKATPATYQLLVDAELWLEVHQAFRIGLPGDDRPRLERARWLINDYADYAVTRADWFKYLDSQREKGRARQKKGPMLRSVDDPPA